MTVDFARVRGVVLGQAVGDCLGLPCEWRSEGEVASLYPEGGPREFAAVDRTVFGYRETWASGEFSDDTEMALCILDSYLDTGVVSNDIAHRFREWLAAKGGRGAGRLTKAVLTHPGYVGRPWAVADEVWRAFLQKHPVDPVPPNGAVMRTAYVGILRPWDLEWTHQAAADVARLTHADKRCVASAVALSVAIAVLVTGGAPDQALSEARRRASSHDPGVLPWLAVQTLEEIDLDEGLPRTAGGPPPRVGHTYKAMAAAFWSLSNAAAAYWDRRDAAAMRMTPDPDPAEVFEEFLVRVVRQGGDTDTNAAVTGALLGAHLGLGIPHRWVAGLRLKAGLEARVEALRVRARNVEAK